MILIQVNVKYILYILFSMCILYKAYAKMSYFMGFYSGFILGYSITYFTLFSSQCSCPILRSSPSSTSSDGNGPCHGPAQAARSHGPDGHHSCRSGSWLGRRARDGQCHHRCFQWRQQLRGTQTSAHTSGDTYKRPYFSVEKCFHESSHSFELFQWPW